MGTIQKDFKPTWWNEANMTGWDRVKEAVRRDWEQTKKDLHVGGHELNQGLTDTVKQVARKEPIPPLEKANPPKVIGSWDDVELPMRYGYGAHAKFGHEHPKWDAHIEKSLKAEWEGAEDKVEKGWDDVRDYVRHGYESKHGASTSPSR